VLNKENTFFKFSLNNYKEEEKMSNREFRPQHYAERAVLPLSAWRFRQIHTAETRVMTAETEEMSVSNY
jgi:hypothetical protein